MGGLDILGLVWTLRMREVVWTCHVLIGRYTEVGVIGCFKYK